jgi:hypothetical protein
VTVRLPGDWRFDEPMGDGVLARNHRLARLFSGRCWRGYLCSARDNSGVLAIVGNSRQRTVPPRAFVVRFPLLLSDLSKQIRYPPVQRGFRGVGR